MSAPRWTASAHPEREASVAAARHAYEERAATSAGKPRAVFVELSQHCNLTCDMCRPEGNVYAANRMTEETFARVAEALFRTAEMVDLRGWGESLLLPEFPERVRTVRESGACVRVVSNFSFRADRALEALAESNAVVSISLDSSDAETLAAIRRGAKRDLIVENIRRLADAYRRHGSDFRRVYIGATVQERSIDTLDALVTLAASLGITDVRFFPRMNDELHHPIAEAARRRLLERLRLVQQAAEREGVAVRVGARLWPEMQDDKPAYAFPCLRPWSYCFVGWDGRIGYCDFLMGTGWERHAIGHLGERSFDDIWNGAPWRELRERHRTGETDAWPVSSNCSWCYRNRFVDFEDDFEPLYGQRVLTPLDVTRVNGA